jgi:hypothetical protein
LSDARFTPSRLANLQHASALCMFPPRREAWLTDSPLQRIYAVKQAII